MAKYIPVIGMEVHVELKTNSKMFCASKNGMGAESEPNVNICPVCMGHPGTLPVANEQAIKFVQMAGLALNCKLAKISKFDRKNYFYPDLPKGYQISQYDQPFCEKGKLMVGEKEIGITRIHLEEDTAKTFHKGDYSLIDFNRAGVPLMELVTEPDFESGDQARLFCEKLRQICRYLEISDADMEKGNMRCEANISLYKKGEDRLSGTKVEIKNLNSFKSVERSINYEIKRQEEVLEKGEKVTQETRGWDEAGMKTISQREKESAHDYRYFPEPDLPPMEFSDKYIEELKLALPEMPEEKSTRFKEQYELAEEQAKMLTENKFLADYYSRVVTELESKIDSGETKINKSKVAKLSANYILTELKKHLIKNNQTIADVKITAENFAELIGMVANGKINSSAAQSVLEVMYETGGDPSQIVEEKNLGQMEDDGELEKIVEKIIADTPDAVADFKAGKDNALKFLMGKVMAETKGKANPQQAMEMIRGKINN